MNNIHKFGTTNTPIAEIFNEESEIEFEKAMDEITQLAIEKNAQQLKWYQKEISDIRKEAVKKWEKAGEDPNIVKNIINYLIANQGKIEQVKNEAMKGLKNEITAQLEFQQIQAEIEANINNKLKNEAK